MAVEQAAILVIQPVVAAAFNLGHELVDFEKFLVHETLKVGSGHEELTEIFKLSAEPV